MKGRVIQSTGSWYKVELTEKSEVVDCRIKGKFRIKGIKLTNPIAAGDWVEIELEEGQETGIITNILERENYIIRHSPRKKGHYHIIASNVDRLYIVATLRLPRTSTGFIDRLLMVAEMYHVPATIIINKSDLHEQKDQQFLEKLQNLYSSLGYEVLLMSAKSEDDVNKLNKRLKNQTNLFAGHSGVGKSTIINQLLPELDIKTREVSNFSAKGMHTTTFATLHPLSSGGYIVDTPGIKELETNDFEPEEASHYFVEMRELLPLCKFNNCMHRNEPKCAVIHAMENGEIEKSRYYSYLGILEDRLEKKNWEL